MKNYIIAGGSSGIGLSLTAKLVSEGNNVFNLDIREGEYGQYIATDLCNIEQIKSAFKTITNQVEYIDGLAIVAGVGYIETIEELSITKFDNQIKMNLNFVYYLSETFLPILNNPSSIITVGSISAFGSPGSSVAYMAAKAGVVGLTKGMAYELASRGVMVNCIIPGPTETSLLEKLTTNTERKLLKNFTPTGKLTLPSEVAEVIQFFLKNPSIQITGQSITIDGGISLAYKPSIT